MKPLSVHGWIEDRFQNTGAWSYLFLAYCIHLTKTGDTFEAEADEPILEAAERAGIGMPHSCRSGTCRACMTRVLSGEVEHDPEYVLYLSIDRGEVEAGYRLLCSSFARSDVELER